MEAVYVVKIILGMLLSYNILHSNSVPVVDYFLWSLCYYIITILYILIPSVLMTLTSCLESNKLL